MPIRSDILSRMAFLPRSTQRIGRVVVREPAVVVKMRAAELAVLCDTDEAAVIRFCRSVGFPGYGDLLEALRSELAEHPHYDDEQAPALT